MTPHQRAEAELTAYGLALPETDAGPGWGTTRCLRVVARTFVIFGDRVSGPDAFSVAVKLPLSAPMVRDLPFVQPRTGWWMQHNWVFAVFGPEQNPLAELKLLRSWLLQSWRAMAPKRLVRALDVHIDSLAAEDDAPGP